MRSCDLCHKVDLPQYIDGKTSTGPWANMCVACHYSYGCGLGVGRGQRYWWHGDAYHRVRSVAIEKIQYDKYSPSNVEPIAVGYLSQIYPAPIIVHDGVVIFGSIRVCALVRHNFSRCDMIEI